MLVLRWVTRVCPWIYCWSSSWGSGDGMAHVARVVTGREIKSSAQAARQGLLPPNARNYKEIDATVIFGEDSPIDALSLFCVPVDHGYGLIVETFNQPYDTYVYVNRVLVKAGTIPSPGQCCPIPASPPQRWYRERVTIGDRSKWIFSNPSPTAEVPEPQRIAQMVITLPGVYEFELSAPEEMLIETGFLMVYKTFLLKERFAHLPVGYQGGM